MKNVSAKWFTNNEEEQRMKAIENRWKKCIEKISLRNKENISDFLIFLLGRLYQFYSLIVILQTMWVATV